MKNLMLFVHPSKAFLPEHKVSIKIEIDNNLSLGWKREDIMLATNFPYEYNGIKSILVSSDNYDSDISPFAPIINVIVELFERGLIEKKELYWYHDIDLYQLYKITESEINLGSSDIGLIEWSDGHKSASSFFFKSSAKDIFGWIKEVMYKYRIDEEPAISALVTNNLLWVTGSPWNAQKKFVPLNLKGSENMQKRVKKLNITYDFEAGYLNQHYRISTKPIKSVHFHFMKDRLLDSAMYGKNSLKKVLMPERLIKIFHKHGVKGVPFKKMKNLMIYFRRKKLVHISPEKKFLSKSERLVKAQIDNSLKLGWKKKDIILLTNFPYEYKKVKTTVLNDNVFSDINDKAYKSNAILHLLTAGIVKETELWWYHDLDCFQLRKIKSTEIDLEDTTAGFMDDGTKKFDTGSFFFRKESNKIFEWTRNRTIRLGTDEVTAFMSLVAENFHHINSKYTKLILVDFSSPENNTPK